MLRVTCQAGDGDAVTRPGLQTQRRPVPLAVTAVSGDSWVSGRGRACRLAAASLGARAHVGFCGDGVAAGGARFGSATGRGPPGGVAGRRGHVAERTRGKQHGRRTARPHTPAARPALMGGALLRRLPLPHLPFVLPVSFRNLECGAGCPAYPSSAHFRNLERLRTVHWEWVVQCA